MPSNLVQVKGTVPLSLLVDLKIKALEVIEALNQQDPPLAFAAIQAIREDARSEGEIANVAMDALLRDLVSREDGLQAILAVTKMEGDSGGWALTDFFVLLICRT